MDRPRLEAFTASGSQSQAASAMDLSKVDSLLVSFQRNIETGFKFLLKTQIGKKNHKNVSTANIRKLTKEIYLYIYKDHQNVTYVSVVH